MPFYYCGETKENIQSPDMRKVLLESFFSLALICVHFPLDDLHQYPMWHNVFLVIVLNTTGHPETNVHSSKELTATTICLMAVKTGSWCQTAATDFWTSLLLKNEQLQQLVETDIPACNMLILLSLLICDICGIVMQQIWSFLVLTFYWPHHKHTPVSWSWLIICILIFCTFARDGLCQHWRKALCGKFRILNTLVHSHWLCEMFSGSMGTLAC